MCQICGVKNGGQKCANLVMSKMCKSGDVKNVQVVMSKCVHTFVKNVCQICDRKSVKFVDASSTFLQNFAMRK